MRIKEDMNICMGILLKSYEKNDHCISHTVIIIFLLNVLKGPLAYQIKTTTTTTTSQLFPTSLNIYVMGLRP